MRMLRLLALVLCACGGPGCAAAGSPSARGVPAVPMRGWTIPRDSVDALFDHANLVIVHPRTSGPYPANLVLLQFRPDATPGQRRAAVDAVGGRLVGGNGVFHYVLVDGACGDRPVWCAIDVLEPLPQVQAAHPLLYGAAPASR